MELPCLDEDPHRNDGEFVGSDGRPSVIRETYFERYSGLDWAKGLASNYPQQLTDRRAEELDDRRYGRERAIHGRVA